jgi:hypothetical protein
LAADLLNVHCQRVGFLDRVNIAVAAMMIAHEFRLNNIQLGAVMSAFLMDSDRLLGDR